MTRRRILATLALADLAAGTLLTWRWLRRMARGIADVAGVE